MIFSENLTDLPELDSSAIDLLATVGIDKISVLAKSDHEFLRQEMLRANQMLRIRESDPDALEVTRWIGAAQALTGEQAVTAPHPRVAQNPVSATVPPPKLEIRSAHAISPKKLIETGIQANEVAVMEIFVTEEELQKEANAARPTPKPSSTPTIREHKSTPHVKKLDPKSEKKPFSLPANSPSEPSTKEIAPLVGKGRQLINAPKPETNAGKKEHSRSYIRGVLHPQPPKVYLAALVSLFTIPMLPLTFVALGVAAWKKEWWMYCAIVPALALFFGFLYLIIATKPKCRICGQPMFVPKRCFRHVKAHRFPLLGYILPTSLQLLLFKWFRCIYCGTAIRLKE